MRLSRSQLSKKYNIPNSQWQRRHDDLLDWFNDFFTIVEIREPKNGYFYYEVPDDLPDTIPTLPRKSRKQEKVKDYEDYVINNLPTTPMPLSKAKMSRDAIADFGYDKYNHNSQEAVSRRYVGPAMDKHGEHGEKMVWVDVSTYLPLTEEQEQYLHECFYKMHLSELEMANAFKKYAQNENIEKEVDSFNKAINMFKDKYVFRPITVYEWQKRTEPVHE